IVLKVATGFYRNRARGVPSGDGMFLLLDAETGAPDLLLEEHGYLTDFRTAAAVGLTLRYLAPKDVHDALLVGAGALARLTARAMVAELTLQRITLWNRTPERAGALAKELAPVVATRVAPALEHAVRDHQVIVTATASAGAGRPVGSGGGTGRAGSPGRIGPGSACRARPSRGPAGRCGDCSALPAGGEDRRAAPEAPPAARESGLEEAGPPAPGAP